MEPKFMNGDRVLVRSQPSVEIGEIGIFIVDGEQYVKIYRGSYLESLNPQYNDIEVSERSFCRGKVIGVLDPEWIAE
ncbi:S24 family peptidase [bacterium 1XD42-1]|nr:S24 family peptidase [bacterium 1XD42-8]RKJ61837.1 S24 family peptidase [bacterium 1XD42-1]